jgi:hypothetical protein
MAKLKSLFHFVTHILSGKTESSQREVFTPIGSDDLGNIKADHPDPTFRPKIISSKNPFKNVFSRKDRTKGLCARTTKNV